MALQTNTKPISTHVTDLSGETTPAHHTASSSQAAPRGQLQYYKLHRVIWCKNGSLIHDARFWLQ